MTMASVRQAPVDSGGTAAQERRGAGWVTAVVAVAGGLVAAFAFPPQGVPGAGLVGAAAGLWAMRQAGSARAGAVRGYLWGLGFGAVLFRWASALDLVAYLALVPIQAVFWAPIGAAVAALARRTTAGWWVVGAAGAWTVGEAFRARWPLGGFEWGQLGLSAADLPLRRAAAVVGTIGVTALTVALAAAAVVWVLSRDRGNWRPLAGVSVAAVALTAAGTIPWTAPAGSLDVAVVQIDDPCPEAFAVDCPNFRDALLARHVEGTETLEGPYDLLLWGEGTLRAPSPEDAGRLAADALDGLPAPLLSGVANPGGPGRFHQRNVLYGTDGTVLGVYDKRHPVPFGEYVPFRDVLGGIGDVGRYVPTDIVRGQRAVQMRVPVDGDVVELGSVVSWEVTFSREVRSAARLGDGIVTLTTQSSYGPDQPVSDQLLHAARFRATELQKPMVVAATTGRSAIITPDGGMGEPTALFARDRLVGELALRSGSTPFAWWGEWPVIVAGLLGAVGAGLSGRRGTDDAGRRLDR